jgi:hypothetical protein
LDKRQVVCCIVLVPCKGSQTRSNALLEHMGQHRVDDRIDIESETSGLRPTPGVGVGKRPGQWPLPKSWRSAHLATRIEGRLRGFGILGMVVVGLL